MAHEQTLKIGRRGFLGAAGGLAAAPLFVSTGSEASAQEVAQGVGIYAAAPTLSGRRKLGSLEVSSIGLGVQNWHQVT